MNERDLLAERSGKPSTSRRPVPRSSRPLSAKPAARLARCRLTCAGWSGAAGRDLPRNTAAQYR
jgi:hypothetical protein